jgi:hypothetical protein
MSNIGQATNAGQYLEYNGTNVNYFNWLQEVRFCDDFLTANQSYPFWRTFVANGASSDLPGVPDSGHPGTVTLHTGTNTNGDATITMSQQSTTFGNLILGGGVLDAYFVIKIPVLSNGTDTFQVTVGLTDTGGIPITNGIYFTYNSTINSGNWQLGTASASTRSTNNTGTAVTTNWTTLRINVNAAASTITYYVNGVSVGTLSTNIPTTTIGASIDFSKIAGTTSRDLTMDLFYLYQYLTSAR